jgi:DUF1680 family protein
MAHTIGTTAAGRHWLAVEQAHIDLTYLQAAERSHAHIKARHWNRGAIVGPDPIGRINWRITRFVKGYLDWLPWPDNYVYLQAQGYWIQANLRMFELTGDPVHLEIVERCADHIVQAQLTNGVWEHPALRERRGFISTVETVWACLGLVAAYQKLDKPVYLDAILKGYDGLINVIGLRPLNNGLAINYYAHSRSLVPNVTTMLLWLLAEIYRVTGDARYLESTEEMLRFLEYSQLESGELQYAYRARPHFQCYQYNSFQFLDLANFYALTGDEGVLAIITRMARFLSSGITERGSCRYDCFKENPETNYWTAALAAALRRAGQLELGPYRELSERAYRRLLSRQNSDGSFYFSDKNYRFLADRRSYPRQQAMILYFLLLRAHKHSSAP